MEFIVEGIIAGVLIVSGGVVAMRVMRYWEEAYWRRYHYVDWKNAGKNRVRFEERENS